MRMHASTQIVPLRKWQAPSWTPNDLTTNFTLSSFACIHTNRKWLTIQMPSNLFIQVSTKKSTGFLKKNVAKHCLYWALHLYNLILKPLRGTTAIIRLLFLVKLGLCFIKLGLRPKTSCSFSSSKSGSCLTDKKDNLGFVLPSAVRRIKLFPILEDITNVCQEELLLASSTFPLFEAGKWYLCLGPLLRGFFHVKRIKCPKMHPQRSTKAMINFQTSCQWSKLNLNRSVNNAVLDGCRTVRDALQSQIGWVFLTLFKHPL